MNMQSSDTTGRDETISGRDAIAHGEENLSTDAVIDSIMSRFNGFMYRCRADDKFTMVYASAGMERLLGYQTSDFVGDAKRTLASLMLDDERDTTMLQFETAARSRAPWNIDYRLVSMSGTAVWVNDVGAPIFDAKGTLTAFEGVLTIVDDRKRTEAQRTELATAAAAASEEIISSTGEIFSVLSALSMLALNAQIEAARAGPAGAGFSIVAHEISELAKKTATLATRIDTSASRLEAAKARNSGTD